MTGIYNIFLTTPRFIFLCLILITGGSLSACGASKCAVVPPTIDNAPAEPMTQQSTQQTEESKTVEDRPAPAPPVDEVGALTRLFTISPIESDWFDQRFLGAIPISKMEQLVSDIRAELGTFQSLAKVDDKYEASFEKGIQPCSISLDHNGRIAGLWLHTTRLNTASFEDAQKAFELLPGKISVLVVDSEGNDLFAQLPEESLAVGSAFKLAILDALNQKIGKKKALWKKTVALQEKHLSLPSGKLQEWPVGSSLTLSTLANLMISISDNTATDMLLDWVGRDRIEKNVLHSRPFLSTREAFVLKAKNNKDLIERYRAGDEKQRREILEEIAALPLPKAGDLSEGVTSDVEWFFSARELCSTIDKVAHLPAMQINPGLADKKDFDQIAFKGGSERGVLNFTTWVKKGERSACVVATWNDDKEIDSQELAKPYRALLAAARANLEK